VFTRLTTTDQQDLVTSHAATRSDRADANLMTRWVEGSLVRALGVWGLAASIVNVTVGGGIFRLPAAVSGTLGAAAPLAYLVCAVAMGLIVLCFAEAGSRVSLTGGLYAYIEIGLGPFIGFICGALLWAGMTFALSAVSSFFADALAGLFPAIAARGSRGAVLTCILVALAALNIAGIRGASRFNTLMTVAKLLPLVVLIVLGFGAIRTENLVWTAAAPSGVARAAILLMFAFLGVESALVPSGEVNDPPRTVPRAIFLAIAGVTVLYVLVQVVSQGILGPALAGQQTPLAAAGEAVMGAAGRQLILVGSVVSMFGYVSGMTLAVPRALYAFARDGFLPAPVAAVHTRYHTPHIAIAIETIVVIILAVTGTFERLAIIANGAILLVYVAACVSVLELRRRNVRAGGTPFRVPAATIAPILAIGVIVWLLTSLESREWAGVGVLVLIAVIVFAITRPGRLRAAQAGLTGSPESS
jgi:APA family basic amino acid/polyamine antiporter